MTIFLIVLVSLAAYIAAGSFVCQYMITRWNFLDKNGMSYEILKFFVSLGLPITIFILIAYLIGDYASFVADVHSEKNATTLQNEKNKQLKLRIEEKQLLQAERDLDAEIEAHSRRAEARKWPNT